MNIEIAVTVPAVWGNACLVALPGASSGESSQEWHEKNIRWIQKLINMSPESTTKIPSV